MEETIPCSRSRLIFTDSASGALDGVLKAAAPASVFMLADSNTMTAVADSLLDSLPVSDGVRLIVVPPGDDNKSLQSLSYIWQQLSDGGATRSSLLVNVGGGMVTDIGGFAAATFKRGIRFVNIPTSLLAAVDASIGGKTGINFSGLKNEVGVFAEAEAVIVDASLFASLPHGELVSGYAELLKHALLQSCEALYGALSFDLSEPDFVRLQQLLRESILVKKRVVEADPFERGLRKALNLGHTAAHAFESLAMERGCPVPHGVAVAWGLIVDLVLSHLVLQLPADILRQVAAFIECHYPAPSFTCADYPRLISLMRHDKKNRSAEAINFTLLRAVGHPEINCEIAPDRISAAFDILRDLFHI